MHMAGHPDDQEVRVELLRAGIGERPGRSPLPHRLDDWLEVAAGGRQLVLEVLPLGPVRRATISARSSERMRSVEPSARSQAGRAVAR